MTRELKIKTNNNSTLVVGSVYKHPCYNITNFENALVKIIKVFKINQRYILLGNFNIDFTKRDSTVNVKAYADHLSNLGCNRLIGKPTRITTTPQSIIDHIYTNIAFAKDTSTSVVQTDISDHLPVVAQLSSLNCAKHEPKVMTRRLSLGKIELFVSELDSVLDSEETQHHRDIAYLVDVMQELTNKYFPKRHLNKKQLKLSQKPLITNAIIKSIKKQHKLYDKFMKTRTLENYNEYQKF